MAPDAAAHAPVRNATGCGKSGLRTNAEINGEVAVLGQQNYLEVWDRARFEEQLLANPLTDEDLKEIGSLGF